MDLNTPHDTTPEQLVADLVDLLDVEEIDCDLFRGSRQPGGEGRVFGGQVIAQALQAAQRSTDAPKVAHSLHAYFMRPGDENHPIVYRVDAEGAVRLTDAEVAAVADGIVTDRAEADRTNTERGAMRQGDQP